MTTGGNIYHIIDLGNVQEIKSSGGAGGRRPVGDSAGRRGPDQ